MELLSKSAYEESIARTRDARMAWWREARFGMFVHFGLYSGLGRHEWAMALESWPVAEYEKLTEKFRPQPGAPREWAKLAKAAGMKYMVMTTRHHEGFSLWDSKANPYNSVNLGPKRDIVREFVDACREYGLKIGFYSSLMDWHHPDGGRAAYDSAARKRFNDYIFALNDELLSNYGKIDVLWYDVALPMEHWEGWNSVEMNQHMRSLQPDIIINNRSRLDEDFGTPEEHITPENNRDWEACMTFNGVSWGYIDSKQAAPYSYNAQRIIKMLATCANGGGNLLLNIGPTPEGAVPSDAVEPLTAVGRWLEQNGEAVYGKMTPGRHFGGSGVCMSSMKDNNVYLWNMVWPSQGDMYIGGFTGKLKGASILDTGENLDFTQEKFRIHLTNLPKEAPDKIAGVTVIKLAFDGPAGSVPFPTVPALTGGRITV